jgi:Fe-S-cluster-containing dehydrogenase component
MNEAQPTTTPLQNVGVQSVERIEPAKGPLQFNPNRCRTCKVCEVACSVFKEKQAWPAMARMNIEYDEFQLVDPVSARLCFQCAAPECMAACPVDAISRDKRSGAIVIDEVGCTGCMQCQEACPWHIPKYHPERGVAVKCDLCRDRAQGPACVEACPLSGKALSYEPMHDER